MNNYFNILEVNSPSSIRNELKLDEFLYENKKFQLFDIFQDDSLDVGDGTDARSVSPCNVTFVGDNVVLGKSSLSSKPKAKKVILTSNIIDIC